MKLLVAEDEPKTGTYLQQGLTEAGFNVDRVMTGTDALQHALSEAYDLLILDVMMPGLDGWEVLRMLRAAGKDVPVLFLTARDGVEDRVKGLELGADDYLTKPFAARELLARIHAVLRRTRMLPPNLAKAEPARQLAFGDWRLDTTARHLLDATGAVVALSGAEYRLLRVLLDHPQRILTRDQLLQLTQGRDADVFDRSIDLLVSRVRQRLGDGARGSRYIKTVRNEGYVFCADVQAAAAPAPAGAAP